MQCNQRQDVLVWTASSLAVEPVPAPLWCNCAAHVARPICTIILVLRLHSCLYKRNTTPHLAS